MDVIGKFLLAVLVAFASATAAASNSVEFLDIELNYKLAGKEMFKSHAITKPGGEVVLTLTHETKKPQYQLRFIASDIAVSAKGTPIASLSVQVFDGQEGAWMLRSDPRMQVVLGAEAMMSAPARFGDRGIEMYELTATVTPMTAAELKVLTGSENLPDKACADAGQETPADGVVQENPDSKAAQLCCSSACAAGSIWYGYTMTCCGAGICWTCGTWCRNDV